MPQVCWKKFCIYFDVEMRAVPVREDYLVLNPKDVPQHVDENTIGVVSIFGSTYNGQFEDVQALDAVVGELTGCRYIFMLLQSLVTSCVHAIQASID